MPLALSPRTAGLRPRNLLLLVAGLTLIALCAPGPHQLAARAAATFTVTSTGDGADSNTADNVCDDGTGKCTLRAAIQQSNAAPGADTINVIVTGTIDLSAALPGLSSDLTLSGPGANLLTVRRNTGGDYRIFTVTSGATVSISGLTASNGRTPDGHGAFTDEGNGGGIFNAGTLLLTGMSVSGNSTGNGVYTDSATANWRGGDGGGVYNRGTLVLTGATVSGNRTGTSDQWGLAGARPSGGAGGGVFNGGTMTMSNSTVSGNETGVGIIHGPNPGDEGGGNGVANTGTLTITNSTVAANIAADPVTASIDCQPLFYLPAAAATLGNSIVAGGTFYDTRGPINSQGHNLIQRTNVAYGPTDITDVDARLGPLADNGGPTPTHALLAGSPALDAGSNALASNAGLTADQRGAGRFSGPGTIPTVDIGAVEFNRFMGDVSDKATNEDTTLFVPLFVGDQTVSSLVATSDNQALVPDANISITGTGASRVLRITPAAEQSGAANINITLDGSYEGVVSQSFGLIVRPVNDAPSFTKGADLTVDEDSAPQPVPNWATALSAGPGEAAQTLSFVVTGNTNPSLFSAGPTVSPSGTLAYSLAPNANGGASVTIVLKDNGGEADGGRDTSAPQTFNINVTPVNDPPAASGQAVTTAEDISKLVTLAGSDVDGDQLTFQVATGPAHGTLSGTGAGRTYTPAADYNGPDSFTFKAVDPAGSESGPATVSITVTAVNDAPSFTKGSDLTVDEDSGPQSVPNWATGISAGPGEGGQAVTFSVTGNTKPALFSAAPAVSPSGTLTYTTAPNANGSAAITLIARDDGGTANGGQDTSATQTFTINVTPVNDPPVAQDKAVTVTEDFFRWLIPLEAVDQENVTLTFSVVSGPTHGTLTGTGSSRSYTPAANYVGPDSFTFKATDPQGADSRIATVSITVTPVNDAPVNTVPGSQATDQNATLVFSAASSNAVSVADVDAGTDPLRVTLTATNGRLTLGGTANLAFTTGDGADDAAMAFAGTINDLNAALAGLAFKPNAGFVGSASLQITTNDQGSTGAGGALTDTDFVQITVRPGTVEFKQSSYTAAEGIGSLSVVVRRTGDTSQAASVAYATEDGSIPSVSVPCSATAGAALDRCDFTKALGRLTFAPGETEKTINVLVGDDSYVEGTETALIRLSGVSGTGVVLGSRAVATLEITDDAQEPAANPIDDTGRFVRQHYHDFLNREPDAPGLAFWTGEIEQCGADAACREVKRVNVSAAFFQSIEFQQTGYLVYRLDKVAFGNISTVRPVPLTLTEFLSDTQSIGQGVVVGALGWEEKLEANKRSFVDAFVLRTRFLSRYPNSATTPEAYVDGLNANAGGALSQEERDGLVADLKGGVRTRAQVLRAVAEHPTVVRRESNQAFVLMQYFGYLRRNPDDAPEQNRDFAGYSFWLGKLNEFNGNYIAAEMVKAFISSDEYRKRFGQ
jgi:CSLREA domain-containing protein